MRHLSYAILHSLGLSQRKLRDIVPDEADIFFQNLSLETLLEKGFTPEQSTKILDKKTDLIIQRVKKTLTDLRVRIVHINDDEYPALLKTITNPPTILYVRGTLHPNDALISIVGSRRHSDYAAACLHKIIPGLVQSGYGIVSGGAYGIDTVAHETTLREKGHTTVVFGAGIDVIYPPSNTAFFEKIVASGGALVSQFPVGMIAEPFNFPIRNETVAGMSRGTLIAEAGEDSGTLITAQLAVEANRDVFVIPADMTREGALGSNKLIRDGVGKLITSVDDILCEYQIVDKQLSMLSTLKPAFSDPIHESIYDLLCRDSLGIDTLVDRLEIDAQTLVNALSMLEIEGIVSSRGGVYRIQ